VIQPPAPQSPWVGGSRGLPRGQGQQATCQSRAQGSHQNCIETAQTARADPPLLSFLFLAHDGGL